MAEDSTAKDISEYGQYLKSQGHEPKEVDAYTQYLAQHHGVEATPPKEPDMTAMKDLFIKNLTAFHMPDEASAKPKESQGDPEPREAKTFQDALLAGWELSSTGTKSRGKIPDVVLPEDAPMFYKIMSQAASVAGDVPAMMSGTAMGGAAGMEAGAALGSFVAPGPGTAVGGAIGGVLGAGAGALGFSTAVRQALMDHYKNREFKSFTDFYTRASSVLLDTMKSAAVGAATAGVGASTAKVLGPLASPAVQTLAQTASEIGTMVTVGKALDGQAPSFNDFTQAALLVGGMHATGALPGKIMDIYAKTGIKPAEVADHAMTDPTVKQDLLADNVSIPRAYEGAIDPNIEQQAELDKEQKQEAPPSDSNANEARDKILSRIGEKEVIKKAPLLDRIKDGFSSEYAKRLDYTSIIKDVTKELGDQPLNEENAHVLMRLHAAVEGKVQEFIETGTRDFKTGEINGEPLTQILNDYEEQTGDKTFSDLKAYGIAERSLELENRGIQQPGSREDDQEFVDKNPHIKEFLDRLVDYKNRVLDYVGESGRYSKDEIKAMKDMNKRYISLKKILEPDELTGQRPSGSKVLKRIGNSDAMIQDPILSTLQDVGNLVRTAQETHATNTFIDQMGKAETPEDFYRVSEKQQGPASQTQIAGYKDGQRTLYDVPKEVADSIKAMSGNPAAMSMWTSLLKPFASLLRLMTVDNPLFGLRHAWRNQLTAPTLSKTGLKPFEALLYAPEYLMGKYGSSTTEAGQSYHDFVYNGGAVDRLVPLTKGYLDGKIYELDKNAPILSKAWNGVKTAAQFSHWAIVINDNVIRYAENKRMLERGASKTEAAFAAREVLPDFQKVGLQKSAFQQITAFLNVHMQGQARMGQEIGENPIGYVAKSLAYITVPSLMLSAAQAGDDVIKDLPDWQKFNYWAFHIPSWRDAKSNAEVKAMQQAYPSNVRQKAGGNSEVNDGWVVRMQKPFTDGVVFGSALEATMDAFRKHDPKSFLEFAKTVGVSVIAEPIPTAAVPVLEQMTNRNFYTGQPIIRQNLEKQLPETQYDAYTSDLAKTIGKMIGHVPLLKDIGPADAKLSSPKIIDNYIKAYSGTLGNYAVGAIDRGLQAAGIQPKRIEPTATLADIPFVKEFMIRFPNAHPQSVNDFQDEFRLLSEAKNSQKSLEKQNLPQDALALSNQTREYSQLIRYDKSIQNMNIMVQKINQAPGDPVQKRQIIDFYMYGMVSAAKAGNKIIQDFKKVGKQQ